MAQTASSSEIDQAITLREKGPHRVSSRILNEYESQWENGESKPKVTLSSVIIFAYDVLGVSPNNLRV